MKKFSFKQGLKKREGGKGGGKREEGRESGKEGNKYKRESIEERV